jgi:hypothetical protein
MNPGASIPECELGVVVVERISSQGVESALEYVRGELDVQQGTIGGLRAELEGRLQDLERVRSPPRRPDLRPYGCGRITIRLSEHVDDIGEYAYFRLDRLACRRVKATLMFLL